MARSHSEKALINVGSGFAVKLVDRLIKFGLKTVFIYTLGIQYASVSTLFTDILSMLALAELGIGTAITYALYKPIKEQDAPRIAALMNFYKKAYRIIAGVVLVAGACCMPFLSILVKNVPDIQEDIRLIFFLYVLNNAASYLLIYKSTLLTASERRYVISRVTIIFSFLRVIVECVTLILFHNFILYLCIGIAEALIRNYTISRQADKYFPELPAHSDAKITKEETWRLLRDVGALSLYRICNVVLNSTDSIVISAAPALGVVAVGYLGNYRLITTTLDTLISQFFFAVTPTMGAIAVGDTGERQYSVFKTMTFATFWCGCFCAASFIALATPFVTNIWLGGKYQVPVTIVAALALNLYTRTIARPATMVRTANGLFTQGAIRPAVMAVLNIALDLALVGVMGVEGVLLATSLSRLLTQLWYDPLLAYRNVYHRPYGEYVRAFCGYFLVTAACCAGTWYLCGLLDVIANVYLSFLAKVLVCAVLPNAVIVLVYRKTAVYADFTRRLTSLLKRGGRALKKRGGKGEKK